MIKALFIAPSYQQAKFYAIRLGFDNPREWKLIRSVEDIQGIGKDMPIYRVGGYILDESIFEAIDYLEHKGIKIIYPLDTEREINDYSW